MLSPLIHTFIKDPKQALTLYHYCQQEEYLYHHSVSVALLSALLAKKLKYDSKAVLDIGFAGLLADAGLAKLPPRLLKKMTDLNDYDIKQFKQHPVFGYQMLKKDPRVHEGILLGVLQHHEKEDGSGYPLGIKGTQLHPYSKIIAVVDYFHAMICSRPHHPKYPLYKALESLKNDRFSKYDSRIVRCFFEDVLHVSIGTKVRLTNQEVGEIIYVDTNDPTRPILRMEGEQTLSLKDHKDLFIDDILSI
nr:HD domain-containing phosphohydrolase [Pullulanibacillus pueri]